MNTMHLIGSEDVARAGHNMAGAADQMQRAANQMESNTERLGRALDDHAMRVCDALERAQERPELRPVVVSERRNIPGTSKWEDIEIGLANFHCWGFDYDEFENGPGNRSVAIVEMPDGTIKIVPPHLVRFEVKS